MPTKAQHLQLEIAKNVPTVKKHDDERPNHTVWGSRMEWSFQEDKRKIKDQRICM